MSFKAADFLFHFLAWCCFMCLLLVWGPKDVLGMVEFCGVFILHSILEYLGDLARLEKRGRLK